MVDFCVAYDKEGEKEVISSCGEYLDCLEKLVEEAKTMFPYSEN